MSSIVKPLLGISRGPFLLLPVALVAAGAAASAYEGAFSGIRSLWALIGLLALHISANALNEASDMQTGIDLHTMRTPFSGGSGTLPAGQLTVPLAYAWGLGAAALGLVIGAWFVIIVGWALLPIIVIGTFSVLAYTRLLTRLGLGELFAGLGLGALPVLGASFVQDGHIGPASVAACIPAFFMTANLLLLNEFPDVEADRIGDRRHLVILMGRRGAARLYAAAVLAVPVTLVVAVLARVLPAVALIAALPTVLAGPALRWAIIRPDEPVPIPAMGGNVAWNLTTNLLLALLLALAARAGW